MQVLYAITYVNITSSAAKTYSCANNRHLNLYLKLSIFMQQN